MCFNYNLIHFRSVSFISVYLKGSGYTLGLLKIIPTNFFTVLRRSTTRESFNFSRLSYLNSVMIETLLASRYFT